MDKLNTAQIKEMLLYVAGEVIAAKPILTEVDSAVGDGDHGIGMETGMKKASSKLEKIDTANVYELFRTMGKTMLMSMGGASGVVFGSMFLSGAKDQSAAENISCDEFARLFRRSLADIQERGKAKIGDKTMVDALSPAVDALEQHAGEGFEKMLAAAEEAAKQGMENTKLFEAKYGRSKTQATTIGFQDAGATSVWVIFKAMSNYVTAQ